MSRKRDRNRREKEIKKNMQNREKRNSSPKVIGMMKVLVYDNKQVRVENIPDDFDMAMNVITSAATAVASYFVKKARADAGGEKKIILPQHLGIILPKHSPN